jgi:membrane-associated phospholipid phosphatase
VLFVAFFAALFLLLWAVFIGAAPLLLRGLGALASRTASYRYSDYLPVGILLAVTIAIVFLAGDALLDITELVQAQSAVLQRADRNAHRWAESERSPGATAFFTAVTIAGTPVGLGVVVAIAAAVLAVKRRWRWLGYLLFTTGVGALLVVQLKLRFSRARPDLSVALRQAHGYSFPSGHAMGSTIVCCALAYLAYRALPGLRLKAAAVALATTFVLAVSLSRVYLGVHWISDVGAGIVAGLLWVTGTTVSYETFRRIRMIRSLRQKRSASG